MNSSPLVDDAMTAWADGRLRRHEINQLTRRNLGTHTRSFVEHIGRDISVDDVTTLDVEDWLEHGLSHLRASSRKVYLSTIRCFYCWATAPGRALAAANPVDGVAQPKVPRPLPRRVPTAVAGAVVSTASERTATMILLALHLGLRVSEIHALRVEHWDRRECLLLVHGKGSKERALPVANDELVAALSAWVGDRQVGPLWPNPFGAPLSYSHIRHLMTTATHAAGLHVRPHDWRHTMASDAAAGGMPVHVLSEWLGHGSLAATTIYARANALELRQWAPARSYRPPPEAAAG
ncbi:MAG TPA: tyrosine-type recombinase/integrase [Iamia sp.]